MRRCRFRLHCDYFALTFVYYQNNTSGVAEEDDFDEEPSVDDGLDALRKRLQVVHNNLNIITRITFLTELFIGTHCTSKR